MAHLYETVLGRLGSRFCLYFKPSRKTVGIGPFGFDLEENLEVNMGLGIDGQMRTMPFRSAIQQFETVEQQTTPTSITFIGVDNRLGIRAKFKFISPYYPQDEDVSHTPVFIIEMTAETIKPRDGVYAELVLDIPGFVWNEEGIYRKTNQQWQIPYGNKSDKTQPGLFSAELAMTALEGEVDFGINRVRLPITFDSEHRIAKATVLFAAHVPGEILSAENRMQRFKYTQKYKNVSEVLAAGRKNWKTWLEKTQEFEDLFNKSTLTHNQKQLIAFGFHSYLANTFWCVDENNKEWWSVWEGNCKFHSTVDVEYNLAWYYLLFEPKLLKLSLDEWSRRVTDRVMAHDMGVWFQANQMAYPHGMPVEENTNYILLAHAYSKITGDVEPLNLHYPVMKTLIEYVLDADTTGNGFPNTGTANTIDDASPAVQFSHEQTYLAVKALSAYTVMAPLAKAKGDTELAARCEKGIKAINETLDKESWLGDHYGVCLDKSADGVIDAWTGKPLSGDLEGWDAYTLYTSNGLLYLMASNTPVDINWNRIKTDLVNSAAQGLCEYGNYHSSADHSNLWVSQNLHRDFVAGYFQVDLSDRADGYMAFEVMENTEGKRGFFIDTYGWNCLNTYPRGATSFGWFMSSAGIGVDSTTKKLTINPPRVPCRMPIAALADWANGKIPWVEFKLENGKVSGALKSAGRLKGWTVECSCELTQTED